MLQFICDSLSEVTGIPVSAPTPFCASSFNPKNWGTSLRSASYANRENSNAKDMAYEILSRDRSPIADNLMDIHEISYVPSKSAAMLSLLAHIFDAHTIAELKAIDPKPLGRGIGKNTPRGTNYQYLYHNGYKELANLVNMSIDDVTDAWGILIDIKKTYKVDTQACEDWYRSLHGKIVDIVMPTMFDDIGAVAIAFANVARQLAEIDEVAKIFTENHKIPVEVVQAPVPAISAPVTEAPVVDVSAAMSQNLTQTNPGIGNVDLDEAFYDLAFEQIKKVIDVTGVKTVDEISAYQVPEKVKAGLAAIAVLRPETMMGIIQPIIDGEFSTQLAELYPSEDSFSERMTACMEESKYLLAGYKKMGIKNINVLETLLSDMGSMPFADVVIKYMTAEYLDIIVQMTKDIALDNGVLPMVKKYLNQKASPAEVVTSAPTTATTTEASAAMQFEPQVTEVVKPQKPSFTQGGKQAVKPVSPKVDLDPIQYHPSINTDEGTLSAFKAFPWLEDIIKVGAANGVAVQFSLIAEPGDLTKVALVEILANVKGVFDPSRSFTIDLGKICSRDMTAWANFKADGKICLEDSLINFKLAPPPHKGRYNVNMEVIDKIFKLTVNGFSSEELKTMRNYGENTISANRSIAMITKPRTQNKEAHRAFTDFCIRGAEGLRLQQILCRFIVESFDVNTQEMIISNSGVPLRYNTPAPETGKYPVMRFKIGYRKDADGNYVDIKRGGRDVHVIDLTYLEDATTVGVDNTKEFETPTKTEATAEKQAS